MKHEFKYKFTYHFYEEKTKFISDETLTIKGRLLYLSAILYFISGYLDFQITSIFGIKFADDQKIEMSYVALFLLVAIIYNLASFLHKYSEDRLARTKIEKDYGQQEITDAKARGELICNQIFDFSEFDKFRPPSVSEYEAILKNFENNVDTKIKRYIKECMSQYSSYGETIMLQELPSLIRSIDVSDDRYKNSQDVLVDNLESIIKHKTKMSSIEYNVGEALRELKADCLKKLDTCLDPQIFLEEIEAKEENFERSISELKSALNKRSVKLNAKAIVNFWIPILFSVGCLLYTAIQFYRVF